MKCLGIIGEVVFGGGALREDSGGHPPVEGEFSKLTALDELDSWIVTLDGIHYAMK